jgi:transposase
VQRDAKEVMAEVLGKLTGKLDAPTVSTSAQENRRGNTVGPNRDRLTVGVDLGDRWSQYCILGLEGETLAEGQLRTTQEDVGEFFRGLTTARVVLEVGTHSAWVQDVITELGHEVLVANPRLMEGWKRRKRKNDRIDANKLARLGRVDPQSLYPIRHRSREVRQDLVVLRARDALVSVRTELINSTRGLVKSMGTRLPRCSSPSFAEKVKDAIPAEVREALQPLVQLVETVNECIERYDERIEELGRKKYGHTTLLRQVKGVGPITSLAYVLTLEDPQRFASSREVEIATPMLTRYVESRQQQGAKNASCNRELAALKRMFNLGRANQKVRQVPIFPRLQENNVRIGFLEDAHYRRLIEHCPGLWFRAALELARTYGWRKQEILKMRVSQVDLFQRTLRLEVGSTKNRDGREVSMTDAIYTLLLECVRGKTGEQFVLTRRDGRPVKDFRKTWANICAKAG